MNIHTFYGQPISTEKARSMGLPIGSGNGTSAPRTRDGKNYPGGRQLRRRLADLHRRRDGEQGNGHCQPDSHRGSQSNWATKPGSMN